MGLNLSQNRIKCLPPYLKLNTLETLNLQGNQIENIKEIKSIAKLQSLKVLYLENNPISAINGLESSSLQVLVAKNCCKFHNIKRYKEKDTITEQNRQECS